MAFLLQKYSFADVFQISLKNTCVGDTCNFVKKKLQRRCFPVKFAKLLRAASAAYYKFVLTLGKWEPPEKKPLEIFTYGCIELNSPILSEWLLWDDMVYPCTLELDCHTCVDGWTWLIRMDDHMVARSSTHSTLHVLNNEKVLISLHQSCRFTSWARLIYSQTSFATHFWLVLEKKISLCPWSNTKNVIKQLIEA